MNEEINWVAESEGIIADVQSCVSQIHSSSKLNQETNLKSAAYLNLETLELEKFTVKLNSSGFTVVGKTFDDNSLEGNRQTTSTFETIYALLHTFSPQYIVAFSGDLTAKLNKLSDLTNNLEQNGN
jgi:hypothetical protein